MLKTAVVILAEGFEEVEGIAAVDVLRRAGVRATIAGLTDRQVKSSRHIGVQADILLKDLVEIPDAVVLPGGMPGATNLAKSREVGDLVKKMNAEGKIIAAICAAPAVVLAPLGILNGKKATCYPGCESDLKGKATHSKDRVVVDGNIITSQGPGTALEFSLEIVKKLIGKETANELCDKMVIRA
jgi:4-methyl-5(b-hydroxyethyl)-thiazole monophosphate biosynthesis